MIQRNPTLWLIVPVLLVSVGACQFDNRDKIRSANATALAAESDGPRADATSEAGNIDVYDLREGDCFIAPPIGRGEAAGIRDVERVPCDSNSTYRVITSFLISDPNRATRFPGSANVLDQAYRGCKSQDIVFVPTRESWSSGDRLVSCIQDYQSVRTNRTDWEVGDVFTVDSIADAADVRPGDGVCDDGAARCTLRAAIMEANALTGADIITVPAGTYTLTLGSSLTIDKDLTLGGAGAESTVIEASTSADVANFGVFTITRGHVAISGVTIRHGKANDRQGGAGILNKGTLTLTNSTVSDNSGIGIMNQSPDSTVKITNSTISRNTGNGIFTRAVMVDISDSTVSDNSGAGIGAQFGMVNITNTTITGNKSIGVSFMGTELTVSNSTVSGNATYGIRMDTPHGIGTLINTIIANNGTSDWFLHNCSDNSKEFTSLGHNLDDDGSCNLTEPTDLPNTDPLLGPLRDNGGPTLTHALLPSSPAIDSGEDSACSGTDQRGVPRPQGSACDIGAYEVP